MPVKSLARRAVVVALALSLARVATAAEYETFIDVDDEDGLYTLYEQNEISETTLNTLVELMQVGVNLDTASRDELYTLPNLTYAEVDAILAYRAEAGGVADPAVLVTAGVLPRRKVAAMAAFLVTESKMRPEFATKGRVKFDTVYVAGDARVPGMSVRARVNTLDHLQLGIAGVLTRNRPGALLWDDTRLALTADPPAPRANLPKIYAQWDTSEWGVIAGTYREGFGQSLTFDDSTDYTPHGFTPDDVLYRDGSLTSLCRESGTDEAPSPCTGDARYVYGSPDWRWREGLFGVSAGLRHLELGSGWLELYGFFSHQNRSVYQYQIYDTSTCTDPRDPSCQAPDVFVHQGDPYAPTTRFSYETLPDAYAETIVGGNATYAFSSRAHLGVTAYGASVAWLVPGLSLDFQDWAQMPYGGPFGAVGVDAAGGFGWLDLFVEVTRSFDSMPDGGGDMGAVLRGTASFGKQEIEASLRYYGPSFYNPYARPISEPDMSDGLRARDEAGLRVKYAGVMMDKRLDLRAMADVWMAPSLGAPNLRGYVRGGYDLTPEWNVGLWVDHQNKQDSALADCLADPGALDANGDPVCPMYASTKFTGLLGWKPTKRLSLSAAYRHELVDDPSPRFAGVPRQDASAWVTAMWRVSDAFRLRARSRWLDEAITDNTYMQQYLWNWIEASYGVAKGYTVRLRYDLVLWLDARSSTLARAPSPENWLWFGFDGKF